MSKQQKVADFWTLYTLFFYPNIFLYLQKYFIAITKNILQITKVFKYKFYYNSDTQTSFVQSETI